MKEVLISVFNRIENEQSYAVIFPDAARYTRGSGAPQFVIHFKTWEGLKETITRGSMGFGESYMAGEIDVEGDLQYVSALGFQVLEEHLNVSLSEKVKFAVGYFSRRNTLDGSKRNIAAHYDLGNDFYGLWLDKEMQYTCAYFETPDDTIEQAQIQKLDLVCRKLMLKQGETVVEAGCGWGGLGLFMARHYGARVRSYNISKEQISFARERAARMGIPHDRLEYVHDDYRTIGSDRRTYDKLVSIGMLEHVGVENYHLLYDIVRKYVKPKGRALIHSIGRAFPTKTDPWLEKYIFPGSHMPALSEMVKDVEQRGSDLHVIDVENLRYHYALTLDRWSERFEEHISPVRARYGEPFVRMFRLYLRSAAAGFRWGGIQLFQMLLSNGYNDQAPLTRKHMLGMDKKASPKTVRQLAMAKPGNPANGKSNGKKLFTKSTSGAGGRKRGGA